MNLKRILLLSAIIMVFQHVGLSQKAPIKFGKISDEEIQMTVYDKDTSAPAVVIMDFGKVEIVYNNTIGRFDLQISRNKRIKILKNEGFENAKGEIRLYQPTNGQDEDLGSFKASTFNMENGKLIETKFSRKDIITEQESKNWILKKYALPNVKINSIIDIEYTYNSPYITSLDDWYFQDDIPVIWSELRTIIPEFFDIRRATGGYLMSDISENSNTTSVIPGSNRSYANEYNRVVFQNVPAFRNERFITTPKDYLAKVEFELRSINFPGSPIENYSTTWEKIAQNLMEDENFGKPINREGIVKELSDQINPEDTIDVKIAKAVQLIKKHMKWDESYRISIEKTLREAFNKNQGNMAEINLLLVNLLRSVGVDAYPVLFSTRSHGIVRMFYPMYSAFNGVLATVKVNGKNILLDATGSYLKPGEIPTAYLNGNGLKIMDGKIEWIPLLNTEQLSTVSMTTLKIADGQVKAEIVQSSNSSSASILRNKIAKKGKEQYIDDFKKNTSDWEIENYTIENEDDVNKPLVEKISVSNFNQIDASGDMIYIPAVVSSEKETNPFISDTRLYPVDFAAPISEKNILNIAIPEGYKVEELPTEIKVQMPENAASFIYMARQNGSSIQVSSTFKILRTFFKPGEYALLKEFYKNMIAKHGEQIVLKKI